MQLGRIVKFGHVISPRNECLLGVSLRASTIEGGNEIIPCARFVRVQQFSTPPPQKLVGNWDASVGTYFGDSFGVVCRKLYIISWR